jgi:predicted GH43/DUF377 family glycosyl hydrolase
LKKAVFLLFCILSVFIISCAEDQVSSLEQDKGKVSLTLSKADAPADVSSLKVELTRDGYNSISKDIDLSDSTFEFLLDEIPAGTWHLKINAMSANQTLLYTGESNVDVVASQVVYLGITLSPVVSKTTGSIHIKIIWAGNKWVDYPANPIFSRTKSPTSPLGTMQAKVLLENGTYKMWYTNLYNSAVNNIGYAESTNGVIWHSVSDQPVLAVGDSGTWDSQSVQVGAIIKIGNTYKMYYTGYSDQYEHWHIGMAVSSDGINWTKVPSPVVYGTDNEYRVHVDEVIQVNNQYYMYYSIISPYTYSNSIGLAISPDGRNWTKYSGNPVLSSSCAWENSGVYFPSIIYDGNVFKMAYMNSTSNALGFATSTDGIKWNKDSDNPFFTATESNGNWTSEVAYPFFRKFNNKYYIYYTGKYNGSDAIGLITK